MNKGDHMSETGPNVAWLIERSGHGGSLEYYGPELSKVAGVDVWLWTDSHLEAIRFYRRTDAERAMVHLRIMNLAAFERANVAEHMWLGSKEYESHHRGNAMTPTNQLRFVERQNTLADGSVNTYRILQQLWVRDGRLTGIDTREPTKRVWYDVPIEVES
jgi:hypothetical protein